MAKALVHFLVPYVGRVDYLRECVLSVMNQSDPRWRLTVVEDGAQGQEADSWVLGLSDERIEYRVNAQPLGLARNFQHCLSLAAAPYLVLLGCDDRLLGGYVAHVVQVLHRQPDVAVVHPGVRVIGHEGLPQATLVDRTKGVLRPSASMTVLEGEDAAVSLMRGNWMYFPALCWRTETIRELGFRPDLPTTLDLELLCRLLLAGHSIALTPRDVVFEYRRHPASASSVAASALARFDEERRLFVHLERDFRVSGWGRAARSARWHVTSRLHALTLLPSVVRSRDRAGTRRIIAHALGWGQEHAE